MHQTTTTERLSVPSFAIIGGGPAGLFTALIIATRVQEQGLSATITIYERNSTLGRKLLLTGAGQCNLTRQASVAHMVEHYGEHGTFLRYALTELSPERTIKLFENLGLPLTVRSDDKVFPSSCKARDVVETLRNACLKRGIILRQECRITEITKNDNLFFLTDDRGASMSATRVVLCTGGCSFPQTGSTGDGYHLAQTLGHPIVPPHPALTGVKLLSTNISSCSGISLDQVALTYTDRNDHKREAHGPLLVTHQGLSGPLILEQSRYFSLKQKISLNWVPHIGKKSSLIEHKILDACTKRGAVQLVTVVHALGLPTKLATWLLQEAGIDGRRKAAEVGRKVIAPLAALLADHELIISLEGSFAQAMVTAGGVELATVNPNTMESHLIKGLFFAGEILDIDGDSGGYNLQAAWSTGYVAAQSMTIS